MAGKHRARGRASSSVRRGQPRHASGGRQGARANVSGRRSSRSHTSGQMRFLWWK